MDAIPLRPELERRIVREATAINAKFPGRFCLLPTGELQTLADDLDTVGVRQLRLASPTLLGTGVMVAQPESSLDNSNTMWQVNPGYVGQPVSLFTYTSSSGTDTNFPLCMPEVPECFGMCGNSVGAESCHADVVGQLFYSSLPFNPGVAPDVAHVDNYEANYFYENVVLLQSSSSTARSFGNGFQSVFVALQYCEGHPHILRPILSRF